MPGMTRRTKNTSAGTRRRRKMLLRECFDCVDLSDEDFHQCPVAGRFCVETSAGSLRLILRKLTKTKGRLQQSFLLKIVRGLGEVGGAAEVAPVILVGAEGEDFFALGGEAEV